MLGALEMYFGSRFLIVLFLAGSVGAGVWLALALVRRTARPGSAAEVPASSAAAVWALGVAMFLVGTLQLVVARNMSYASRWDMAGYHLYLPNWGLGLASVGLIGRAA